jgi:two-component sensor histidine kinase
MRREAPAAGPAFGPAEYARAVLNILEDFAAEKERLQTAQKAVLNILDDFHAEKLRLEATQRAILNVLEDFGVEKRRLEATQSAVLNILDDLGVEKARLEEIRLELMQSERAIRASLGEKEILLREIHHRVKNNLQVTSSLLKLQSASIHDPRVLELFAESQNRIRSMALVHEKLYQSSELARVDVADYARSLGALLFRSFGVLDGRIGFTVDAADVFVSIETAVPCGLILNELVSNCLKHAFPGDRGGAVVVTVRTTGNGSGTLVVADDGAGLPPGLDLEQTETLGLQLVRTLVRQLRGTLAVSGGPGTEVRIGFEEVPA